MRLVFLFTIHHWLFTKGNGDVSPFTNTTQCHQYH